jgi:hypothetical protein
MRFNKEYTSLDEGVDLKVHTKSPTKWILVDRETGETYQGNNNGSWDRLDPVIKD